LRKGCVRQGKADRKDKMGAHGISDDLADELAVRICANLMSLPLNSKAPHEKFNARLLRKTQPQRCFSFAAVQFRFRSKIAIQQGSYQ